MHMLLSRSRLRFVAVATAVLSCALLFAPSAEARLVPGNGAAGAGLAPVTMYGYAPGPAQRVHSAAGQAHYVQASATRAWPRAGRGKGHRAPVPDLAPPAMGTRSQVRTGAARMAAGHEVAGHRASNALTAGTGRAGTMSLVAGGGTDNATYSIAASYDAVPLANQGGEIAVTVTNTGTSTWNGADSATSYYALGARVFSAGDWAGSGAPLGPGAQVSFRTPVAPGASVTVEGLTPAENPGSYTLCWDMINPAGTYFSDEGGNEYCAPYTIAQYPPAVNEQEPLPGTDVDTQSPQLSASATIPGGYPAAPAFSFAFELLNGPNLSTAHVLQSSGWVPSNGNSWAPSALTWGTTYYWAVAVTDATSPPSPGGSSAPWTTPISFVVGNAQPTVTYRFGNFGQAADGNPVLTTDLNPDMTSGLGAASFTGSGKTVDPKTANVSEQVTDAKVATAGPPLSVVRTYNSLDPRTSQAMGGGWSSILDMSLLPDQDGTGALILTLADGQQVRFAKNAAGGYAPPQGLYAVVAALSGGGFTVTDQTGTTYAFGQASGPGWLISQVTDVSGHAEMFSYASGALAAITSATSGRALHLTWGTPAGASYPHVATVTTDPVLAGQPGTALTWAYSYSGDLLTAVCPPGTVTACTRYTYITSGSHAATSVLNANPTSYLRLDDPTNATVAVNQVPVNDLTAMDPPAAEFGTTPGVPGPVSGVTATGFNGTSSFIPLDGAWCSTPGQVSSCVQSGDSGRVLGGAAGSLAVSVWFKTSTPGRVLLSMASTLPGATTAAGGYGSATVLSIAGNGDLQGYGSCTFISSCTYMSSPAPVDDGNWHQAVLIPGQALYLDGGKVASFTLGSGGTGLPTAAYVLLGAGMGGGGWSYFNGSVADLSVYQNQLPGPGTVAAQYAAQTRPAAELSSITSPAGRTELSASYDTVNDRVATLTDSHGGSWTFSGPVPGASSAAYDDAVLGSSAEDFWPLSDTAGPLARDLVDGAGTSASPRPPATYANVTLGAAGPTGFPDGTAATFSGAGSQVSIPGGYFAGNGAESAELWFQATAANGTLLSSSTPNSGGDPMSLWISGGCLNGIVGTARLGNNPLGGPCAGTQNVSDGKWHQVVLTLSAIQTSTGFIGGAQSQQATMYLDGVSNSSAQIPSPAAVSGTGYTAYLGTGSNGAFAGSLADVSFYTRQLISSEVAGHYKAVHNAVSVTTTSGFGQTTTIATPTLNTQTITVTNPAGKNAAYVYADGRLVRTVSALGGVTSYGYDPASRASTITDPDGNTTYTTHDAHNNVTSVTTCAAINDCQTAYTSYYENLSSPLDPRTDKPTGNRDARSSSPADPAYDTVTAYTPAGLIASRATPPTLACPTGCKTSYAYTAGSEAAAGGGTEPAGLLKSVTGPGGGVVSYTYNSAGDVAQVTDPLGLVTKYSYDNLGRQVAQTQISDSYPNGLTTSYAFDGQDRLVTTTDPPVRDRVTGVVHTMVTTDTYDADGNVLTAVISDSSGGDQSRTTTDSYDAHGNLASARDPLGNVTSYTYDGLGDKLTQTNPAGTTTSYGYDAAGELLTVTLDGYTGNPSSPIPAENFTEQSRAYDPAGRLASVTDTRGATTAYTYYGDNRPAASYVVCPSCSGGREHVRTNSYDAAGDPVTQTAPGGTAVTTLYNADKQPTSQTVDPAGVDRTATASYDADGNIVAGSLSGGGVTQTEQKTYNAMNQLLSQTADNTGGNLTTSYTRDQRGLVITHTDPVGNTTTYVNDEAGRTVVVTSPAVPVQAGNGSSPVTASPVTKTGYDTFGDITEKSDPDGNVTRYAYNGDGEQVSVTSPSYTPPGASSPVNGTASTAYDSLGLQASTTDPLGNITTYTYDQLGDMAAKTDPDGGTWTYTYDPAKDQASVTDPTGAQTQATYDNLGQLITSTDLVRQNTSAAYTTSYGYDDAGNQISQTSPTGARTRSAYDATGEKISATDAAGNTTSYAYNLDGSLLRQTSPDGTATTVGYDQAGREISQSSLDASGTVLRTQSTAYNLAGQVISTTDSRGDVTTFARDALGRMTSATQPTGPGTSITVSYGYDLAGNRTSLTDGNGNTTYLTYNSLGLPETVTEPPTAQYSTAASSQVVDAYNANGEPVTQTLPGGVQVTDTYDANGDLTGQSGGGAAAPTAARGFTYDKAGRMLSATTSAAGTQGTFGYQPTSSESFSYDDRGLLLSSSGTAGTTGYSYNGAGQVISVSDAAGTSSYTYDSAGRLATDASAASGATGTYGYNSLDQVTSISYGAGGDTQTMRYDSLHRLTSDAVTAASGATLASIGYGYDGNDNVTSETTTGLAAAGGGTGTVTSTYGYDQANRLTSWTATPAGGTAATHTYGYDNSGNLVSDNGIAQTYNSRNELTSDGYGNTYSYTADGDLAQQDSPGNAVYNFTSDAYGQQITDGFSSFAWDALNRVTSAGQAFNSSYNVTLSYDGRSKDVASDPSAVYSYDTGGQLTGVHSAADGKTAALLDAHGDLSGTFAPAGTSMASSSTWDPWGQPLASAGPAIQLGYQGQWTDPVTGQVSMGSRMYRPAVGGFINQDTYIGGEGGPAVTDNLHAYADDNPVTQADPTGQCPSADCAGAQDSPAAGAAITQADLNADHARIQAASQAVARLKSEAAKASQNAARFAKAAQSFTALARKLNSQAAQLEAQASQAAAAAASAYQSAQAALQAAKTTEARANAEQAAAQRDLTEVEVYTIVNPVPQTAAAFQREANAENAAAAADRYAATMLYFAYDGLMSLYNSELAQSASLRTQALVVTIMEMAAQIAAIMDSAAAAAYAAEARTLNADAAAASKDLAADIAQYNADLKAYQAAHRAPHVKPRVTKTKNKKPYIPPCLYNPKASGCGNWNAKMAAAQKFVDNCERTGYASPSCQALLKADLQWEAENTPCNGENYGECNPSLSPSGTDPAGVISDIASGVSLFLPEDAAFANWLVNTLGYILALL
jgi:RHS repeat-associated protein